MTTATHTAGVQKHTQHHHDQRAYAALYTVHISTSSNTTHMLHRQHEHALHRHVFPKQCCFRKPCCRVVFFIRKNTSPKLQYQKLQFPQQITPSMGMQAGLSKSPYNCMCDAPNSGMMHRGPSFVGSGIAACLRGGAHFVHIKDWYRVVCLGLSTWFAGGGANAPSLASVVGVEYYSVVILVLFVVFVVLAILALLWGYGCIMCNACV